MHEIDIAFLYVPDTVDITLYVGVNSRGADQRAQLFEQHRLT
ncbi:Uncharacterised protein [Mycobacteroides abscessus subsp. abscessus]|nr:Uncharacterised protein [Mycobacteroides abscessus subsp. abscessus]